MRTHTEKTQSSLTPADALRFLKEGNLRFRANLKANRNLLQQVNETRDGQFPFAAVLSCIDSRTSAELIFDQGLGDVFSVRIAGNGVNADILGSLEFACKVAGAKLIVVLGHTSCGAIKGACDGVELGHLTALLGKIRISMERVPEPKDPTLRSSKNGDFVQAVALENVHRAVSDLSSRSLVLHAMQRDESIWIVGAMYDVSTGEVTFFHEPTP